MSTETLSESELHYYLSTHEGLSKVGRSYFKVELDGPQRVGLAAAALGAGLWRDTSAGLHASEGENWARGNAVSRAAGPYLETFVQRGSKALTALAHELGNLSDDPAWASQAESFLARVGWIGGQRGHEVALDRLALHGARVAREFAGTPWHELLVRDACERAALLHLPTAGLVDVFDTPLTWEQGTQALLAGLGDERPWGQLHEVRRVVAIVEAWRRSQEVDDEVPPGLHIPMTTT